jgi:hypothetical protein
MSSLDMNMYLVFSALTSIHVSLLASDAASVFMIFIGKGKADPLHNGGVGGRGAIALIHDLGSRWRCVVSVMPRLCFSHRKGLWYPWDRRLDGPHSWSGHKG